MQPTRSIRTRITLLTVCAIIVAVVIATTLSVVSIMRTGASNSDQMLLMTCETGQKNLNSYFESVEQSVETVSTFAHDDLSGLEADELQDHIDRMRAIFGQAASQTNGVLTYYYRIDPSISDTEKGFWYVNLDGEGFEEHEVTDITLYDTEDTSNLVWFTVPKSTGKAVWLPPYITDNLDVRVISYNEPVYWDGRFIGVVGIEMDYSVMAREVDHIRLYENGYAFMNDEEGNIIYHPYIDVTQLTEDTKPKVPAGLLSDSTFVRYIYNGAEKQAVWLPLSNGMRLNVSVPVSEINRDWQRLIWDILVVSAIVLLIVSIITSRFAERITKPLRELTTAAEQVDGGNYDVELNYGGNDEVGVLTRTFNNLVSHLKVYIDDLNSLAYADALTSVHNKGAFDINVRELQAEMDNSEEDLEFAIGVFDCDNLKSINDRFGHEKGNVYLKTASHLICRVFQHSPVFRVGGDEFAAVLRNEDYKCREELLEKFTQRAAQMSEAAANDWEQVSVTVGIAVYDAQFDASVRDVVRRADMLMYENKRAKKAAQRDALQRSATEDSSRWQKGEEDG